MDFKQKIKSAEEVAGLISGKTSILAAGTFDIVHPGHIRHLLYCKSKAEILIANVTADAHVSKGISRPYVPEDLRAMNLAVLGMVDFVVIDRNETPLENIRLLQPNFFAKGYEYDANLSPKTQEEKELVESYGGKMLFTPGDVIYSSTELLKNNPRLGLEKLLTLMDAEGLTFSHLRGMAACLAGLRVHLVGDTIVDSQTITTPMGGAAKTPTLSVRYERRDNFAGGAAIVAKHLAAAGAHVEFSTVLGTDSSATLVANEMDKAAVSMKAFQDGRVTTNKDVIIAQDYRLLKIDRVDNRPINEDALTKLKRRIEAVPCDIMIFSDFRHGIFNSDTIPILTEAIPGSGVMTAADSQVASRWGNILDFQDFDLITPNEREARFSLGDQDSVIRPLAYDLYRAARCKSLILKCGEAGTLTVRSDDNEDLRSSFALDSFAESCVDAVGAGDALLAYSALALKRGAGAVAASILGGIAAGLECERNGNIPVASHEIVERLTRIEKMAAYEMR